MIALAAVEFSLYLLPFTTPSSSPLNPIIPSTRNHHCSFSASLFFSFPTQSKCRYPAHHWTSGSISIPVLRPFLFLPQPNTAHKVYRFNIPRPSDCIKRVFHFLLSLFTSLFFLHRHSPISPSYPFSSVTMCWTDRDRVANLINAKKSGIEQASLRSATACWVCRLFAKFWVFSLCDMWTSTSWCHHLNYGQLVSALSSNVSRVQQKIKRRRDIEKAWRKGTIVPKLQEWDGMQVESLWEVSGWVHIESKRKEQPGPLG